MDEIREKWDNALRTHYVYGHYTLDTNQLFYVGIGTRRDANSDSNIYQRAYVCAKSMRNKYWLGKFKKHGRRVEILFDNLTEKEAKEKEIELIAQYGTYIKKTGTLCNISEGGEGRFRDTSMCKKIYVYNLEGNLVNSFDSCQEAAAFYNLEKSNVGAAALEKRRTCGDYQFRYEYNKDHNIQSFDETPRRVAKPIIASNISSGESKIFDSVYQFRRFIGAKSSAHIYDVLLGRRGRKKVKGWEVKYANT